MSTFKSKAIIIKITKIKEKDFIYDIFTYDFGKIKVQKKEHKKEKSLDLGYIINCEIETKGGRDIHRIKNIKIKSEFNYEKKDFKLLNAYLNLIGIVYQRLPIGQEFKDIFEIFDEINDKKNIDETKLILAKLKIINLMGELDIQNENKTIEKILNFINKNKIKDILKLTGIQEDQKQILDNIN